MGWFFWNVVRASFSGSTFWTCLPGGGGQSSAAASPTAKSRSTDESPERVRGQLMKEVCGFLEFMRCLTEEAWEHRRRMDKKSQAYQGTLNHFCRLFPGTVVIQQTFVMSCHSTILEGVWDEHFAFWGMKPKSIWQAKKSCIKAGIMANHMLAEVRRSQLEGLKLGGRSGPPGAVT